MADESEKPERICVIGCPGTGKSTLAVRAGHALDLPVYHLDRMFWRAGWVQRDEREFDAALREVIARDRWIIDGNYARTMPLRFPRAQAIVWLDLPLRDALWGVLRRYAHTRGRNRPDMGDGCPERWDWEFIQWVLGFNARQRNREHIQKWAPQAKVIHITRRRQVDGVPELLGRQAAK
jgi:adenylate kinase family enzyme